MFRALSSSSYAPHALLPFPFTHTPQPMPVYAIPRCFLQAVQDLPHLLMLISSLRVAAPRVSPCFLPLKVQEDNDVPFQSSGQPLLRLSLAQLAATPYRPARCPVLTVLNCATPYPKPSYVSKHRSFLENITAPVRHLITRFAGFSRRLPASTSSRPPTSPRTHATFTSHSFGKIADLYLSEPKPTMYDGQPVAAPALLRIPSRWMLMTGVTLPLIEVRLREAPS
jgi:hypothetical protein